MSLMSLADSLMAARGSQAGSIHTGLHQHPWAPFEHRPPCWTSLWDSLSTPRIPHACLLCLRRALNCFLNTRLVGNLCGPAARKQKLIIHISRPEGAVVCRVDCPSGFQTQNSPRPLDKRKMVWFLETAALRARGQVAAPRLHAVC